jgi:hypothetical protein
MRTVTVSVDVFAALWAARQHGEQSEDDILRRILNAGPRAKSASSPDEIGFQDARYGVTLPPGFRIARVYLRKEFVAEARGGCWRRLDNNRAYPSLNELSRSIGAESENAWENWFFDENGARKPLSVKRDPTKVRKRNRFI